MSRISLKSEWFDGLDCMDASTRALVVGLVAEYLFSGEAPDLTPFDNVVAFAFGQVKPMVNKAQETSQKRATAGSKGGKVSSEKKTFAQAKDDFAQANNLFAQANENEEIGFLSPDVSPHTPLLYPNLSSTSITPYNPPQEKEGTADKVPQGLAKTVMDLYNGICRSLPRKRILNDELKQKVRVRYRQMQDLDLDPMETFKEIFTKMEASDFLTGRSGKGTWRADFDWVIKSPNYWILVIEGRYENNKRDNGADGLSPVGVATRNPNGYGEYIRGSELDIIVCGE